MKTGDTVTVTGRDGLWRIARDEPEWLTLVQGMEVATFRRGLCALHSTLGTFRPAVTIGTYRMPDFLELAIVMARATFGKDTPILVSEDMSRDSDEIRVVAARHQCYHIVTDGRLSHCAGDWQHFVNAVEFGRQVGATFSMKLSVRLTPLPGLEEIFAQSFANTGIDVVLPSRPLPHTMIRPQVGFYSKFGLLTDLVAWRTEAMDPAWLAQFYKDHVASNNNPAEHIVELAWGKMLKEKYAQSNLQVPQLANPEVGKPKLFLRKAQSSRQEYVILAKGFGINGVFDTREWRQIEGKEYRCLPQIV